MKYLLLILTSMFASAEIARAMEYDSEFTQSIFDENREEPVKPGDCISASSQAHLVIVRKIGSHAYETSSIVNTGMYEQNAMAHGILSTRTREFDGPGETVFMKVRYKGVKLVTLENGFSAKFGVWEECR